MKTIQAQFNHGRWIGICPKCLEEGKISALVTEPNKPFVCAEEYPDLLAKTLVPNPRKAGAFNAVPDEVLREETFQKAIQAGDSYEVIFPAEKAQIEAVLRVRPSHARSWFPGVSVADLVAENERNLAESVVEPEPQVETEPEPNEEPEPDVEPEIKEEPVDEPEPVAEPEPESEPSDESMGDENEESEIDHA